MSWTDEEIDNLFKDGANAQTFKYDDAYFAEMEAASLPVNKKGKDFLWMGTALLFVAVLTTGYFVNDSNGNQFGTNNDQLANLELNTNTNNENVVEAKSTNNNQQSLKNATENGSTNSNSDVASNEGVNADRSNSASTKNNGYSPSQNEGSSKSIYNGPNAKVTKLNPLAISKTAVGTPIGMTIDNQAATTKPLVDVRSETKSTIQKQFNSVRGPITAGLDINSVNQLDQGIDQSLMPNALPVLSELRPKAAFYVELNGGVSQSLITPSDMLSKSLGGGVGVETYLGNFNLTTGLNFKASNHDDLFLTWDETKYGAVSPLGFTSTTGSETYDIQRVYSFEMPISLGYNFGRHNVNIGVRPSFIFGGKMEKQTFSDDQVLTTERRLGLPTMPEFDGDSKDGFKNYFGMKPTLGYAYRMNKWTIGANIGVQLVQSVNEELIEGVNNTLPIDGQIYIRRTIRLRR